MTGAAPRAGDSGGIALIACVSIDLVTALVWALRELTRPEVERVWKPGIGWTNAGPEL
jgi:hypothetical protein